MNSEVSNSKWLFSPAIDLSVFLGSALAAIILLIVGSSAGFLEEDSPDWTWITAVLMIDVAHVWATSFRVYFDIEEFKRRIWLYTLAPISGYLIGVALYSESALTFWRVLAYIAVFHFVRQQYGWVNLYRAKAKENSSLTWWIDAVTIYLASIYPLAFWMTRLPRNFEWFVQNDFIDIPNFIEQILFPIYVLSLLTYFAKSVYLYFTEGFLNVGKDIVVATTAICWYVGIVYFNSDYAFTVTNVIIHGVPYFAIVYFYAKARRETASSFYRFLSANWLIFLATLWFLAYIEEFFWHRGIWHERLWLFGSEWEWSKNLKTLLVPLLALPQFTHYVLDGFVWRRKALGEISFLK
ncbi:MAG: hypothetical protein K1X72_04830 [Pyrinomonadaceae bacterium]|nr:hypothetical protein [Pyrinomonadaceae bacterium]